MRKINTIIALSLLAPLFIMGACTSKKSKLTANTLTITISSDPATTTGLTASTGQLKLTAVCKSAKSTDVDISPTWTVTSTLGSFSNAAGKATTFTAGATAGSGSIYATYGSVVSTIAFSIGAGGGGGTGYVIYADAGASTDIKSTAGNIFQYFDGGDGSANAAPWLIDVAAGGAGCAVDPVNCSKVTYTGTLAGEWGGFYLELNAAKDVTAYTKLTFYVKGGAGGETYQIKMKGGGTEVGVNSTSYVTMTTSWQKVTIPFTDFGAVSFASLQNCFTMAFVGNTPGVVYLDYIQFE